MIARPSKFQTAGMGVRIERWRTYRHICRIDLLCFEALPWRILSVVGCLTAKLFSGLKPLCSSGVTGGLYLEVIFLSHILKDWGIYKKPYPKVLVKNIYFFLLLVEIAERLNDAGSYHDAGPGPPGCGGSKTGVDALGGVGGRVCL